MLWVFEHEAPVRRSELPIGVQVGFAVRGTARGVAGRAGQHQRSRSSSRSRRSRSAGGAGRVGSAGGDLQRAPAGAPQGDESWSGAGEPSRATRSDAGQVQLSVRDVAALLLIGEMYGLQTDHAREGAEHLGGGGAAGDDAVAEGRPGRDRPARRRSGVVLADEAWARLVRARLHRRAPDAVAAGAHSGDGRGAARVGGMAGLRAGGRRVAIGTATPCAARRRPRWRRRNRRRGPARPCAGRRRSCGAATPTAPRWSARLMVISPGRSGPSRWS